MGPLMRIRPLDAADVPVAARLRIELLEETGGALPPAQRQALLEANQAFFQRHLGSPAWQSWVAEFGPELAPAAAGPGSPAIGAIGTLAFFERPPYPGNPLGRDAYLLNMFTSPAYRGKGAARAIVQAVIGEARRRGVRKLILHATEAGRPIYAEAGFGPSMAYMELALDDDHGAAAAVAHSAVSAVSAQSAPSAPSAPSTAGPETPAAA